MEVSTTGFRDLWLIKPRVFEDERGYFFESFNLASFSRETGLKTGFVQDNEAKSNRGVIRGLHFQHPPFAQSKLVRVIRGKVLDVVLDIRPGSATFGEVFSVILSGDNKYQLFVPKGFAHGYAVLEDETVFAYKCDAFYNPGSESGIRYDDPQLGIDWLLRADEIVVSVKDRQLPFFGEYKPLS
jgi:dTDP-4-dehydrorhamnose 3,5-epimerase